MKYIALFNTTIEAVKYRRKLENLNIEAEAVPVPRELSASCGIAIIFSLDQDPTAVVDRSVQELYCLKDDQYIPILPNEERNN